MDNIPIGEREHIVIEEISRNYNITQRKISKNLGISLGMTNLILKRLTGKGYIKVKQLSGKKVRYILTPKGFAEKAKKSYRFILKTIDSLRNIKGGIQKLIMKEYEKGEREFVICGIGELATIAEIALRDLGLKDVKVKYVHKPDNLAKNNSVILSVDHTNNKFKKEYHKFIDILDGISRSK